MKKIALILFAILFMNFQSQAEASENLDRDEVFEWANQLISGEWIRDDGGELYVQAYDNHEGILGRAMYEIESVTFDKDQTIVVTRFLASDVLCRFTFKNDERNSMSFENLSVESFVMNYTK